VRLLTAGGGSLNAAVVAETRETAMVARPRLATAVETAARVPVMANRESSLSVGGDGHRAPMYHEAVLTALEADESRGDVHFWVASRRESEQVIGPHQYNMPENRPEFSLGARVCEGKTGRPHVSLGLWERRVCCQRLQRVSEQRETVYFAPFPSPRRRKSTPSPSLSPSLPLASRGKRCWWDFFAHLGRGVPLRTAKLGRRCRMAGKQAWCKLR